MNISGTIALDAILTASSAVRSQAIKEPGWKMADVKKINHTGTALDVIRKLTVIKNLMNFFLK